VIEGVADRFLASSPRAEFSVAATLKGSASTDRLTVDFEKAPYGRWPKTGERRILCLVKGRDWLVSGSYELAGFHASILPPSEAAREKIRDWIGGWASMSPAETVNAYAGPVGESDTILFGELSNVREGAGDGFAAVGTFKVQRSLLGYGKQDLLVLVYFQEGAQPPRVGRYLLLLKGREAGDGFIVVDAVPQADAEGAVKRQILAALGSRTGTFTTVQATLAEWQAAWNARDLDRCILCYAKDSDFRKRYDAGGEARGELAAQIKQFPCRVELTIERTTKASTYAREGDGGASASMTAEATVLMTLSAPDWEDRRRTTMKFVFEDGEWLVFDEGF